MSSQTVRITHAGLDLTCEGEYEPAEVGGLESKPWPEAFTLTKVVSVAILDQKSLLEELGEALEVKCLEVIRANRRGDAAESQAVRRQEREDDIEMLRR